MRALRASLWLALTALVVLGARALAYALAPATPLAAALQGRAVGPALPAVAGVSLVLALVLGAVVVWLASLAVRERHLLSGEVGPAPRLCLRGLAVSAVALWMGSSVAFTGLESLIHARAGLGFHGVECLTGPVHGNALPLLAALSLLAAAFRAAAAHVWAWARRTARLLRARRPRRARRPALPLPPLVVNFVSSPAVRTLGARGPPSPQTV